MWFLFWFPLKPRKGPQQTPSAQLSEDYGRDRAFRTFEGLFGDVHARWRPGLKVTGAVGVSLGRQGVPRKAWREPEGTTLANVAHPICEAA